MNDPDFVAELRSAERERWRRGDRPGGCAGTVRDFARVRQLADNLWQEAQQRRQDRIQVVETVLQGQLPDGAISIIKTFVCS